MEPIDLKTKRNNPEVEIRATPPPAHIPIGPAPSSNNSIHHQVILNTNKMISSNHPPKIELPRATAPPVVSLSTLNPPLVLPTTQPNHQHIRIPTAPTNIRPVPTVVTAPRTTMLPSPRAHNPISLARTPISETGPPAPPTVQPPIGFGHHRLPMNPIVSTMTSTLPPSQSGRGVHNFSSLATKTPVSLAVLQQHPPSETTKLTVVNPIEMTSKSALTVTTQPSASIRPIGPGGGVTLTTGGYPLTIRPPNQTKVVAGNASIQLVPLSTANQNNRPTIGSNMASIRQITTNSKPPTIRTNHENTVKVTLVQSPATISKIQSGISISGSQNYLKPVTITSQTNLRQLRPQAQINSPQPLRLTGPNTARMTVIPSPGSQPINVSLNPQINVPLVSQQQQPMARLLTPGGPARLISVSGGNLNPPQVAGVTIQKTVVTTTAVNPSAKTISLPYGSAHSPKTITGSPGFPMARVIPNIPSNSDGNLVISNSVIVTSVPSSETGIHNPTTMAARSPNKLYTTRNEIHDNYRNLSGSPSKPGILRRREGERELIVEPIPLIHPSSQRPDSRDEAGSSSGSTTLSATSSPCDGANLSSDEVATHPPQVQPSPRKKPRKQQHSNVRDQSWTELEENHMANQSPRRKIPVTQNGGDQHIDDFEEIDDDECEVDEFLNSSYLKGKPPAMSLINSYRHTWKSRHNHFERYTDVRAKEDQKPTVNEIANQEKILQKIEGWKIYHLTTQIEEVMDIEVNFSKKLNSLQKRLDKLCNRELSKDLSNIHERIKANLQRSKVIQDQVRETKNNSIQLFDHKERVQEILNRYIKNNPCKTKTNIDDSET